MGLESTLDAFAGRNLAHGKSGVEATVTLGDDNTFIGLQTLAGTFLHFHLDNDGVAGCEVGEGFAEPGDFFLFELFDDVHDVSLHLAGEVRPGLFTPQGGHHAVSRWPREGPLIFRLPVAGQSGQSGLCCDRSSRSGRNAAVSRLLSSCRPLAIAAWLPPFSTSGTAMPCQTSDRVKCGQSSRQLVNDSW